jgi:hypothetical protein
MMISEAFEMLLKISRTHLRSQLQSDMDASTRCWSVFADAIGLLHLLLVLLNNFLRNKHPAKQSRASVWRRLGFWVIRV